MVPRRERRNMRRKLATLKPPWMSCLTIDQVIPTVEHSKNRTKLQKKSLGKWKPSTNWIPQPTLLPRTGQVSNLRRSRMGTLRKSTAIRSASCGWSKRWIMRFGPTGGMISAGIGSYLYSLSRCPGGMSGTLQISASPLCSMLNWTLWANFLLVKRILST
jgi:hypothetical protein